jgi:hypothetical protein
MMNIPNSEYWLHPDRRLATLAWMNRMMAWIAVLISLVMIGIGHVAFMAKRTGDRLYVVFFCGCPCGLSGWCVFNRRLQSLPFPNAAINRLKESLTTQSPNRTLFLIMRAAFRRRQRDLR